MRTARTNRPRKDSRLPDRSSSTRASYARVRAATLDICAPLQPEDYVIQAMADVSPPLWHLAHTTWFFERMVRVPLLGEPPYRPGFGYLFNSYYEGLGDHLERPHRGWISRPGVREILDYRCATDEAILNACEKGRLAPGAAEVIELGCQHEMQHQELLYMDIQYNLSCNPLSPAYLPRGGGPSLRILSGGRRWVEIEAGLYRIGALDGEFAFDHERPRHRVWVEDAEVASEPVTNSEFEEFIQDGGYTNPRWWLSEGWALVTAEGWRAPLYWKDDQEYSLWGGMRPRDPRAPVRHVSYFEADAYGRWKGARLPTEAEWEIAAPRLSSTGQVWEWTASAYTPYPGFRPNTGALAEYNGKFMCNQFVLRGGCEVTPAPQRRITARNYFPPHSRWAFSGFRIAKLR